VVRYAVKVDADVTASNLSFISRNAFSFAHPAGDHDFTRRGGRRMSTNLTAVACDSRWL